MSWFYLFIAAIFEVGWPLGFKLATVSPNKLWWILFAIFSMALSGVFLFLAQKQIPMGTAYAIWTGIGTACTFFIGVLIFNDAFSLMRILGILLIITGVVFLKLAH